MLQKSIMNAFIKQNCVISLMGRWSIGQSLYYAQMTGKKPAVGFIMSKKENRFLKRLERVAKKFHITIFIIKREVK